MNKLGNTIRMLRKLNNMTVDDLSEKIGIHKSTLHRYEIGKIKNIPGENLHRMSEIFKIPVEELVGLDNVGCDTVDINSELNHLAMYLKNKKNLKYKSYPINEKFRNFLLNSIEHIIDTSENFYMDG